VGFKGEAFSGGEREFLKLKSWSSGGGERELAGKKVSREKKIVRKEEGAIWLFSRKGGNDYFLEEREGDQASIQLVGESSWKKGGSKNEFSEGNSASEQWRSGGYSRG